MAKYKSLVKAAAIGTPRGVLGGDSPQKPILARRCQARKREIARVLPFRPPSRSVPVTGRLSIVGAAFTVAIFWDLCSRICLGVGIGVLKGVGIGFLKGV